MNNLCRQTLTEHMHAENQNPGSIPLIRRILSRFNPFEKSNGEASKASKSTSPDRMESAHGIHGIHAIHARHASIPLHRAMVEDHVTIAPHARVRGELRVPNTLNFGLFRTLDPYARTVYYELYLLSHGFRRNICSVSLPKLAASAMMSARKVHQTITYLEKRGLVRRLRMISGGPTKVSVYQVLVPGEESEPESAEPSEILSDPPLAPPATVARHATLAPRANNKSDDDIKTKSSSKIENAALVVHTPENHSPAAAPRERETIPDDDLDRVRSAYERTTGNRWNRSDTDAFLQNRLHQVPVEKIIATLESVAQRTPTKVNSFNYFVREIVASPDTRSRAWRKKQLERIIRRVRDNATGLASYTGPDFLEDVKCACARERVPFDNDLFNELAG